MLSQKARYALRAMLYLARKAAPAPVQEIAVAEAVPRKYLEQIMVALKARGLVASRRGAQGGYSLARGPDAISFADIIRCIDGPLALAPCVSQTAFRVCPDCRSLETCEIRPALLAVRNASSAILEGMSLLRALEEPRGVPA